MNIEKGMMGMMMAVMMAGVMMAILPQPAEPTPPPPPEGYGCPYCTLSFDSMSELVAHISEAHPGESNFQEVDIGWS